MLAQLSSGHHVRYTNVVQQPLVSGVVIYTASCIKAGTAHFWIVFFTLKLSQ